MLRIAAIEMPAGTGLCAPLDHITSIHPKMVTLYKQGVVHTAFLDYKILLMDMESLSTNVNELIGQETADICNIDAPEISADST